jgi:hypothetical protein
VAHPKHEDVRRRYSHRGGYCGVSETDAGDQLTVDHYRPVSKGGGEDDDNLVYACFKCNLYKSDFHPDADNEQNGQRLLHPLLDEATAHIQPTGESGRLEPLTDTGRFHIELLQLNLPALVRHRLTRWIWQKRLQSLEEEIGMLTATVTGLELHVARLEKLVIA